MAQVDFSTSGRDRGRRALKQRWCKCVSQLTAPAELCKASTQPCIDVKVLPPLLSDPGAKGKWAKRGTLRAQGVMVISGVELQRAVGAVVGWWAWGLCRLVCSQLEPRFLQGSIASACPPSPPIPPHSSTSHSLLQGNEECTPTAASDPDTHPARLKHRNMI